MARKGSRKVRTGCITCKIRKVKCDEGRPSCMRCSSTGRTCDGYSFTPLSRSSTSDDSGPVALARLSHGPRVSLSEAEVHSIDFFRLKVAPKISCYLGKQFWTGSMQQVGDGAPAVRFSISALSTLYRGFDTGLSGRQYALRQYNRAIKSICADQNETEALVTCVMMTYIEFMLGNMIAASEHCRHGVSILNSPSTSRLARAIMLPTFRRLSMFPALFGFEPRDLALLDGVELPYHRLQDAQIGYAALEECIEFASYRALALLRDADQQRHAGPIHSTGGVGSSNSTGDVGSSCAIENTEEDHDIIKEFLASWYTAYRRFVDKVQPSGAQLADCYFLEAKYFIANIWIAVALDPMAWMRHDDSFRALVELSQLAVRASKSEPVPALGFEMRFVPLLCVVAMKCRDITTRIAALESMKGAAGDGNGWDLRMIHALAARSVTLECGIPIAELSPAADCTPSENDVLRSAVERLLGFATISLSSASPSSASTGSADASG